MALDKSSASVRSMFSVIAWRYDLLNHLLSANQDKLWRKRAIARLRPPAGSRILDLCCGTGDLSLEILKRQPGCEVIGADFAEPMLEIARVKGRRAAVGPALDHVAADALALPFPDQSFDIVTVAFGVRNFEDTARGMQEIARVLRPGGKLMVLEFMRPAHPAISRFFGLFNLVLAPIGRNLSGHQSAYNYLPQSIGGFYTGQEFVALLHQTGFGNVRSFQHSLGVATSFLAAKNH